MDVDDNTVFGVDEVVTILSTGHPLGEVSTNPIFKVIQSDMSFDEAQSLLEPEFDIFMNVIKDRSKQVYARDILQKEIELQRQEIIDRVIIKEPETFEQTEDVVVG